MDTLVLPRGQRISSVPSLLTNTPSIELYFALPFVTLMVVNELQTSNAPSPIEDTLFPNVTDVI